MVLIKKKLILSTKKEQGAVAVEISLIFFPFIFIILFMFEICRVIYISSALDLAVAEASRYAAISQISEVGYQKVFIDKLNKDIPLMPLLTADKNIYVNVNYCSTIEDVIINNCDSISNEKPLAIYTVGYNYTLLFDTFEMATLNSYLQRSVIYVQEYNRDNN